MDLTGYTLTLLLARLAAGAASLGLIALIAGGLALGVIRWSGLQSRAYRIGLRNFLMGMRSAIFVNRGLAPSKRLLRQMTNEEAQQIIHAGWPDQMGPPPGVIHLERRIREAVGHPDVIADFRHRDRESCIERLIAHVPRVEERWHRTLTVVSVLMALPLAVLLQISVFEVLAPPEGAPLLPVTVWPGGLEYYFDASHCAGVLISALICGVAAARVLRHRFVSMAADDNPRAPPVPRVDQAETKPDIGEPHRPVRAINFSSGGFDTLMHLGVIHSLVVIQGRAPDVVVGISAGAIHAAALAEVLQAGDAAEKKLEADDPKLRSLELQRLRVFARIERLRRFIELAQRTPERLLDAILPDASQVDAGQPLQPLQQPRLSSEERSARRRFVVTRFGLAQLYNDILNVPLRISTMAKAARRVLGIVAAGDIRPVLRRYTARFSEVLGLWILFGANLTSVARLVRVVGAALLKRKTVRERSAAGLIFRVRAYQRVLRGTAVFFLFVAIGGLWFVISTSVGWAVALLLLVALLVFRLQGDVTAEPQIVDTRRALMLMLALAIAGVALRILWFGFKNAEVHNFKLQVELAWMEGFDAYWTFFWWVTLLLLAVILFSYLFYLFKKYEGRDPRSFVERLLSAYGLDDAIFREHGLRNFFVELFDPEYYARAGVNRAVEAALDGMASCTPTQSEREPRRTLANFHDRGQRLERERIHVGIAVANTETGALEIVRPDVPIVDALVAATAITPWMPAVELPRHDKESKSVRQVLYVSGSDVTREPTHALLKLIRERQLVEGAGELHIYSVSPFPVSTGEAGPALSGEEDLMEEAGTKVDEPAMPPQHGDEKERGRKFYLHLDLIDIAWRAIRMRRLRDAGLEFRLTHLFTKAMPPDVNAFKVDRNPARTLSHGESHTYYRAWVKPVELEYDGDLNRRLYRGAKTDRRRIIAESIADGCRVAMQVMIRKAIKNSALDNPAFRKKGMVVARCADAVRWHLKHAGVAPEFADLVVPGSDPQLGPGLSEICEHCTLRRPRVAQGAASSGVGRGPARVADRCGQQLSIKLTADDRHGWPHELASDRYRPRSSEPHESPRQKEMREAWERFKAQSGVTQNLWPEKREVKGEVRLGNNRPLISFLFGGGVFRGVYQIGVLNALNDLDLQPDIIGGASVGSITAAMIAETFSIKEETERRARVARLAATYLAIDRLVLTDRLADFIRTLTLRATETRFSIRDADRVFRRYDQAAFREFDRNVRQVVGGLERLLYLSPYELNDLVRSLRDKDPQRITEQVSKAVQRFLDRMQVGEEILGTEALRDLIATYVIGKKISEHTVGLTIDELRQRSQIMFLATATNLTWGRLEVLGSRPNPELGEAVVLEEALLASSAFPGGFRPRWSWEVMPGSVQVNQYVDGGVMDNLPIDAVAATLHRAGNAGLIAKRPGQAPHLIIGASLETRANSYALAYTRKRLRDSWIRRMQRASQLGFNSKLEMYEFAEQAIRDMLQEAAKDQKNKKHVEETSLVDMQLVSIKPDWLCGSFAFHPMLGFRREKQARSIAHGCATTLLEFAARKADRKRPEFNRYVDEWGIPADAVPKCSTWEEAFASLDRGPKLEHGHCWLRPKLMCPFSRVALEDNDRKLASRPQKELDCARESPLGSTVIREVSRIHDLCRERTTHLKSI